MGCMLVHNALNHRNCQVGGTMFSEIKKGIKIWKQFFNKTGTEAGSECIDLLKCYVCEQRRVIAYEYPIDYSVCSECGSVFVLGKDGTISYLDHARAL